MYINIENIQSKGKNIKCDRYHVVKENDVCLKWEYEGDDNLYPMRECRYCRFSDFRKELSVHSTHSVCRCPIN